MNFEYTEDLVFFERLLCQPGEALEKYKDLFDLRPPNLKRSEFDKRRNELLNALVAEHGNKCFIAYSGLCDLASGRAVDHLIPLSSNKLNKELRGLAPEAGKKVLTQSFGSNHILNLIPACSNCNNHKKHRFLEPDHLKQILKMKFAGTSREP